MAKSKNGDIYAVIAAIACIIYGIIVFIRGCNFGSWMPIVLGIVYISLGALLFIRKKNIALLIPVSVSIVIQIFQCAKIFSIQSLFGIIAWALLLLCLIINVFPNISIRSKAAKAIGILPALCWFLGRILPLLQYENFAYVFVSTGMMDTFLPALFMLFTGIWLVTPETGFQPDCMIGDADKLMEYKDLLDSGVITQEEFFRKKKEILGSGENRKAGS